jgi:hypothetical protein
VQASILQHSQKLPAEDKMKLLLRQKSDELKAQKDSDYGMKVSASTPILRHRPMSAAPTRHEEAKMLSKSVSFGNNGSTEMIAEDNALGMTDTTSTHKRPQSATVLRHRNALMETSNPTNYTFEFVRNTEPSNAYVLKGGFKLGNPAHQSNQELLAQTLANQFQREVTISMPHDLGEAPRSPSGLTSDKFNPLGKETFQNGNAAEGLLVSRRIVGSEENA